MAGTWSRSQEECEAAGGHLASLGHDVGVEVKILETVGVSDWWTGGNICPDSPGECQETKYSGFSLEFYICIKIGIIFLQ